MPLLLAALAWALPAQAADVTLKARDGTRLHAVYQPVQGASQGVVLVHMLGRSARDWRFLSDRLNRAGFSTLAVDLRGHGANLPKGGEAPEMTEDLALSMVEDVRAAVAFLAGEGVQEISLVGASIGANLSLLVAADDPSIRNVVLLSPGMNIHGLDLQGAVGRYGERPLLIAVSEEDRYAARTALVLDAEARGTHHLAIYQGAGHGTRMLNKAPDLEPLIVSWLLGTWQEAAKAAERRTIDAGDRSAVETHGEKLPSHQ